MTKQGILGLSILGKSGKAQGWMGTGERTKKNVVLVVDNAVLTKLRVVLRVWKSQKVFCEKIANCEKPLDISSPQSPGDSQVLSKQKWSSNSDQLMKEKSPGFSIWSRKTAQNKREPKIMIRVLKRAPPSRSPQQNRGIRKINKTLHKPPKKIGVLKLSPKHKPGLKIEIWWVDLFVC